MKIIKEFIEVLSISLGLGAAFVSAAGVGAGNYPKGIFYFLLALVLSRQINLTFSVVSNSQKTGENE